MNFNITLLIPAYNEETTISRALNSVYNQNLPENYKLDVIVLNNGSVDNTLNKCKKIISKFNKNQINFYVQDVKEANKGNALNVGLSKTSNEIVCYMDADAKLESNTIFLTTKMLFEDKKLQLVGALDIPLLEMLKPSTLLYDFQKVQQISREERGRVIPCGRYICFRKSSIKEFPTNIHSEDTWLGLTIAKYYGWSTVKVLMEAKVYFTPPKNWLDFIKQQSRFERGFEQLVEKFPELEAVWENRRTESSFNLSKDEIKSRIIERLQMEGIKDARYSQYYDIINEIFVETSESLSKNLINDNGKWDPILSTKTI